MTRNRQGTDNVEDVAALETEEMAVKVTGGGIPDLEIDASLRMEQQAKSPFAGYDQLDLEVYERPLDPLIERWDKADLLQYCMRNDITHKEWTVKRDLASKRDEHLITKEIKTTWSADEIRTWLFRKLLKRIPSHWIVFNLAGDTKPGVPHSRSIVSPVTKRFHGCEFDVSWPMATPKDPYYQGTPNRCCVVDDDYVRAALMYINKPVTGEVIRRCIDPPKNRQPWYGLFKRDAPALLILEKIYRERTRPNAALRQWEREQGGLPTAM